MGFLTFNVVRPIRSGVAVLLIGYLPAVSSSSTGLVRLGGAEFCLQFCNFGLMCSFASHTGLMCRIIGCRRFEIRFRLGSIDFGVRSIHARLTQRMLGVVEIIGFR